MVGKRSVTIVAATALLLGGGGAAFGGRTTLPGGGHRAGAASRPGPGRGRQAARQYDVVEYEHVEDDGSISLNVDTTPPSAPRCAPKGYTIGAHGRGRQDARRAAGGARRDRAAEALARDIAKSGVPRGAKVEGKSVVPIPGETVIQRANTFTNYAARFLYVEAHNKATSQTGPATVTGRTLALSFAGADGVFGAGRRTRASSGDTDPKPDVYMYHRQLVRLPGAAASIPADQMTVRVRAARPPARNRHLQGHRVGGQGSSRRTSRTSRRTSSRSYMDPTENRANLDALAAEFPNLVTPVNLPEPDERVPAQVAGDHGRHERHRRDPAGHARPRADRHHGRDHGRAAGRQRSRTPVPRGRPSARP